jgi:hypothetical protein
VRRHGVFNMVFPLGWSRRRSRPTVLVRVQPGIIPLAGEQFLMCPVLDNASLLEHQNGVCRPHGRQAMGDEEHGTAPTHLGEIALDNGFRLVVERTCGFVKDENAWVAHQSPGNGQALALTTGQCAAVLAYQGVIALW